MKCSSVLVCVGILFLSLGSSSGISEDDVKCLKGIKQSVNDPLGNLNSWDFNNTSVGNISKFVGVACWNDCENRIFNLKLQNMKLSGSVPQALEYCVSLQNLDLRGNNFSGTIPSQICTWLPFLIGLDLSNNDFSGCIPPELAKCTYLNSLILSDDRLSGNTPYQLTSLSRLRKFSVAYNELSGAIPPLFVHLNVGTIPNHQSSISKLKKFSLVNNQRRGTIPSSVSAHDFAGNRGLCGGPLGTKCGWFSKNNPAAIIFAGLSGAAASLLLALGLWCWYLLRLSKRRTSAYEMRGGDDWSERLKAHKLLQVCLSVKPLVKVMLADLIASTNNFDPQNIIISTRHVTIYKAVLRNGSALAIKQLNTSKLGAKGICIGLTYQI
ncbi:hypothetical protein FEM48_Zijuj04G0035400 [Ziziphus jujuba var. spinosa]|uniref:Leucine-rich repeat-containing N-terminal plant-type domain-containing protein n=1 Tax=Ziziphus jujuba var. spinosa TaxID=714518 RepID=A0A978VHK8_ZIZJJ|nr:hypothetical protein FEM48_Zijuj04G0035400 [Ziziphus jujuba var. spinosa]